MVAKNLNCCGQIHDMQIFVFSYEVSKHFLFSPFSSIKLFPMTRMQRPCTDTGCLKSRSYWFPNPEIYRLKFNFTIARPIHARYYTAETPRSIFTRYKISITHISISRKCIYRSCVHFASVNVRIHCALVEHRVKSYN